MWNESFRMQFGLELTTLMSFLIKEEDTNPIG